MYHIGVVGSDNSYHCYTELADAELCITRFLNIWHQLGYAIERPLEFPDAVVKEWLAYDGVQCVRQMMLVIEDDEAETIRDLDATGAR
jgi:hypothetical protein